MYWNTQRPTIVDKPILKYRDFRATESVAVLASSVSLNKYGDKVVREGHYLAEVNGVDRFLPRAINQVETPTSSAVLNTKTPEIFLVGDVLYSQGYLYEADLGGTWATGDVAFIRASNAALGVDVYQEFTLQGADASAFDAEIVAAINAIGSSLAEFAYARTDTDLTVSLYFKGMPMTVQVGVVSSAAGTFAESTAIASAKALIGTIQSIDYQTGDITLAANAAVLVPMGVGFGTLQQRIYGLYNHSTDFTERPTCNLAAITEASGVYLQALPYYDLELRARFPKLVVS